VAVVALAPTRAETAQAVPAPVLRDLEAYAAKRLKVANLTTFDQDRTAAARQQAPECADGAAEGCLRALAASTGATILVAVTVERPRSDSCRVTVSVASPEAPSPGPTSRGSDRCRLQSLEAATELALGEQPLFRALRGSPPPPHPACEDVCTAGERSCDGRGTTLCGDDNWDGCTDWTLTACPSGKGCSKGACIDDRPDMVLVGEGPYLMGSSQNQLKLAMDLCQARSYACVDSWWRPEQPAHWVQISGFYIDRTEVTNAAFATCVKAGKCKKPDVAHCGTWDAKGKRWVAGAPLPADFLGENKPVVCVTHEDADRYCKWSGKRLPTEAEWEKAARGTDGRVYPWGDTAYDGTQANGCDARCGAISGKGWRAEPNLDDKAAYVAEVGTYLPGASPYGAVDMAGNVWEWVSDWFDEDYYKISERKDPPGPGPDGAKPFKVLRGGSWSNEPDSMRSSYRYSLEPTQRLVTVGFRCAYP
jgi:formylglycine-generating enzyme required for sulfatase activity